MPSAPRSWASSVCSACTGAATSSASIARPLPRLRLRVATAAALPQAATGEPMTEEDAEDLVKSIDADGNGEIDVDEFIALVRDQM